MLTSRSTPLLYDHPLSAVKRLLIKYIRSYPPYLETVSSIRVLRTCYTVVTIDQLKMAFTECALYDSNPLEIRHHTLFPPIS